MRCYFLRGGQIAGVNMLPRGLSDQDVLGRAETQSLKRSGPIDGLEVWDRARLIFRRLGPIGPGHWTIVEGGNAPKLGCRRRRPKVPVRG